MSRIAVVPVLVVASLLAGCATPSTQQPRSQAVSRVVELVNGGFEDDWPRNYVCPPQWGCVMHSDPHSFRYYLDETAPKSGKRSLCIEPVGREPWARANQFLTDRSWQGARIRFSVDIRFEGKDARDGTGGGPFISMLRSGGQATLTRSNLVKGPPGWQRVQVELDAPMDAFVLEFGVALVGTGKVCADDARLEIIAGS